ncbi:MAG: hypothetical protein F6K00_06165 [Leptolyngbya sp. SIOISBB]|nr:hypothetical protein [Leptolyngbya sp. SIOISBB]
MSIKFRVFLCELGFWLTAEVMLGFLGFDDLADYTEYLKQRDAIALLQTSQNTPLTSIA